MTPTMKDIERGAESIARTHLAVLIVGEQGTGKERLARLIHRMSSRSDLPLHTFDCAASPPDNIETDIFGVASLSWSGITIRRGAIEEATAATLLLDEFQAVPLALQTKVARALEYGSLVRCGGTSQIPVSARIIMTLTVPYWKVSREALRDDVQHRIGPIVLELPPLRERRAEIPGLVMDFLDHQRLAKGVDIEGISDEALRMCCEFDWPGNVRQLKNAIEYASLMCSGVVIEPSHLPEYVAKLTFK